MISFTLVNMHLGGSKVVLQVYLCEATFMCNCSLHLNQMKASFFSRSWIYQGIEQKNNLNVLGKEAMEKVVNIFFNHKNIQTIEEYKAGQKLDSSKLDHFYQIKY